MHVIPNRCRHYFFTDHGLISLDSFTEDREFTVCWAQKPPAGRQGLQRAVSFCPPPPPPPLPLAGCWLGGGGLGWRFPHTVYSFSFQCAFCHLGLAGVGDWCWGQVFFLETCLFRLGLVWILPSHCLDLVWALSSPCLYLVEILSGPCPTSCLRLA